MERITKKRIVNFSIAGILLGILGFFFFRVGKRMKGGGGNSITLHRGNDGIFSSGSSKSKKALSAAAEEIDSWVNAARSFRKNSFFKKWFL